mgnify:CR=1 FL=1
MFLLFTLIGLVSLAPQDASSALDQSALTAYRDGDPATASALWTQVLEGATSDQERGRLCYNLGNTAYRRGKVVQAVAWYHAALRHTPRDGDLWANLEFCRAEAELGPADRGDLAHSFQRLLFSFTRGESEWLLAGALALLALAAAGEALRGGIRWRRLFLGALVFHVLAAGPLLWHLIHDGQSTWMVTALDGSAGHSEPSEEAKQLAHFEAGALLEELDRLPDWVKLADQEGRGLWVRAGDVFSLVR